MQTKSNYNLNAAAPSLNNCVVHFMFEKCQIDQQTNKQIDRLNEWMNEWIVVAKRKGIDNYRSTAAAAVAVVTQIISLQLKYVLIRLKISI